MRVDEEQFTEFGKIWNKLLKQKVKLIPRYAWTLVKNSHWEQQNEIVCRKGTNHSELGTLQIKYRTFREMYMNIYMLIRNMNSEWEKKEHFCRLRRKHYDFGKFWNIK